MSHGVSHFEIPADDPDKLSDFYVQLFDWQIQKFPGEIEYWMVSTAESDEQGRPKNVGTINGGLVRRQHPDHKPVNYVTVDSVDASVDKANTLGASVLLPKTEVPGMGWFAWLMDPEGNQFAVWEDATRS